MEGIAPVASLAILKNPVNAKAVAVSKSRYIQLAILLLGALVTVFNAGVTNIALPTISASLHASGLQIQLIANAFILGLTAAALICGAIGDKFGRKLVFMIGCAALIPASVMAGLSTSADSLIFWRFITGVATALLFPTTLSMITIIFQSPKEKIMAIGLWSAIVGAGTAIAPVVAGLLLNYFSWGSVFYFSIPFAAIALFAGFFVLAEFKNPDAAPIDWFGAILTVIMILTLVFAIVILPSRGFDALVMSLFLVSFFSFVAFVVCETKVKFPLLDLDAFGNRRFSVACFMMFLIAFTQLGIMFLAQEFLQNVLGYSALFAGLAVLPCSLASFVFAPISAKLDGRFGSKLVVAAGFLITGIGFTVGLFWTVNSGYLSIFAVYLLIGIGLGLVMTPVTNAIMGSLSQAKAGVAAAMNEVSRDFGMTLGIAVNGAIAAVGYDALLTKVYGNLPEPAKSEISQNVATIISSSLTGALQVAKEYPGTNSQLLVETAGKAFLHGQIEAMALSVTLCLLAVAAVLLLLPARAVNLPDNPVN